MADDDGFAVCETANLELAAPFITKAAVMLLEHPHLSSVVVKVISFPLKFFSGLLNQNCYKRMSATAQFLH